MKIDVIIMTCPGREAIFELTKASLKNTDWPRDREIFVSNEQGNYTDKRDRLTCNAKNALTMGLDLIKNQQDRVLILEDDVGLNSHIHHNLQNWKPLTEENFRFGSLYNPNVGVISINKPMNYFIANPNTCYGSQAYIFSKACIEHCLAKWDSIEGMTDIRITRLSAQVGPLFYHVPSLVQHLGRESAWGGHFHYTSDYSQQFSANPLTQ